MFFSWRWNGDGDSAEHSVIKFLAHASACAWILPALVGAWLSVLPFGDRIETRRDLKRFFSFSRDADIPRDSCSVRNEHPNKFIPLSEFCRCRSWPCWFR